MREIIIGVFRHSAAARRAIEDLRDAGFAEDQIGLLAHERKGDVIKSLGNKLQVEFTRLTSAMGAGLDRGSRYGIGSRSGSDEDDAPLGDEPWALHVTTSTLPAVGEVVTGGMFAFILDGCDLNDGSAEGTMGSGTSESERAVIDGLAGVGITMDEARHYTRELMRGRSVILVQGRSGAREVLSILGRHRSFERTLFRVPEPDDPETMASGGSFWS